MKVILSALKAEAFPLINYYKLIPSNSIGLQMYRNDLFTMLITGVGKKNVNKTLKEYLKKTKNIEVLPISNLMGEAIKRISNSTSVSDLFK